MATYVDLAANLPAVQALGDAIALSQMFGCAKKEQGFVIAADCFLTGMPLLEYQARNHFIMGKPSMSYDAMLADFHKCGGESILIEKTPERAAVKLVRNEVEREFSLTWEDAQKEPFVYEGKEADVVLLLNKGMKPTLKAKYATPRSRSQMLFARVVSDAIRTIAPEVCYGHYTPEEIEDFMELAPAPAPVQTASQGNTPKAPPKPKAAPAASVAHTTPPETSPNTPPEIASIAPSPQSTPQAAATAPPPPAPPKLDAFVGTPPAPSTATSIHESEPLTDVQYKRILSLLQSLKESGTDFIKTVKDKLAASGLGRLTDLSTAEGDILIRALEQKEIDNWVDLQLKGPSNPT